MSHDEASRTSIGFSPADAGFTCNDGSSHEWIQRVSLEWDRYFERCAAVEKRAFFDGLCAGIVCRKVSGGDVSDESVEDELQRGYNVPLLENFGSRIMEDAVVDGKGGETDSKVLYEDRIECSQDVTDVEFNTKTGGQSSVARDLKGPNGGKSFGRGKNYERNQLKREKKRKQNSVSRAGADAVCRQLSEVKGVFSDCSAEVQLQLRESRAKMLIAQNEAATAKAQSYVRHCKMVSDSRVNETKFELNRQTVEEKLQKISARRLGLTGDNGLPTGKVETIVSDSGLGSYSTPSITSGSVSPNSSVSMQEYNEMKARIEAYGKREAELTCALKALTEDVLAAKSDEKVNSLSREQRIIAQMNRAYEFDREESIGQDYPELEDF